MTLVVDEVVQGPHVLGDITEGFGSISITVAGGTGTYTYEWTASLADGTTTWENGDDIDGLFAGTYTVVATDENGCNISADITVPFYTPSESKPKPSIFASFAFQIDHSNSAPSNSVSP